MLARRQQGLARENTQTTTLCHSVGVVNAVCLLGMQQAYTTARQVTGRLTMICNKVSQQKASEQQPKSQALTRRGSFAKALCESISMKTPTC